MTFLKPELSHPWTEPAFAERYVQEPVLGSLILIRELSTYGSGVQRLKSEVEVCGDLRKHL